MYIYIIKDNKATLLGQQGSYDQLIEQETYPALLTIPIRTPSCLTARQRGFTGSIFPIPQRS